jgi:RNA polymerase sigma-70 factor (ECF subfamily)
MIRFCWGYLQNLDDAEDAVQDIFVSALKAGEVPDNFRAWLYRIARNHCLNLLRSRGRRRDKGMLPSDSWLAGAQTGPLSRLVKAEDRSRIAHLVAALPGKLQEALRLRYAEGLSRAEIAEVVEVPESLVKSRLYEGMKKLREHTAILRET